MKKEAKEVRRRYCVHLRRGASSCFIVVESSPSSSQLKIFIRTPRRIFSQAFFLLFIFAPTAFVCSYSPWPRARARSFLPIPRNNLDHTFIFIIISRELSPSFLGSRRFIRDHLPIRSTRRSFALLGASLATCTAVSTRRSSFRRPVRRREARGTRS